MDITEILNCRSSSIELLSSWPEFYVYLKVVLPQVSAKPPDLFILVRWKRF